MRTTAPKCRINRPDSASGRCAASSHPPIYNALRLYTASSRISSGLADIGCGLFTTACFAGEHSPNGMW